MPGMNDRLREAMDRLAAETARAEPPRAIEAAVLAEFDRVNRRRNARSWLILAGAVAASLAIVLILENRPQQQPPARSAAPSEDVQGSEQPFVPIPYVTPLGPYERAEVVRMEVPVAALIAAGLPVRTADPGARAQADVVVGQDGRMRAIRLISISRFN
jgi:hypothetical protein